MLTNTSGAIKLGTGGYLPANERLRIGAAGGISIGNSYVATDPGAGNLILSGKMGIGTTAPAASLEVNGTAKFDGLITFDAGQTFPGTGTITGITTTSPLTGSGTSGSVALGLNTTALEGTLNGVYAQLGAGNTFTLPTSFDDGMYAQAALGTGYAAVIGDGVNGTEGVEGVSDSGQGVVGNVTAPVPGSEGVLGYTGSAYSSNYSSEAASVSAGVWADTSGAVNSSSKSIPAALFATADAGFGGAFVNSSPDFPAIYAQNSKGVGIQITASGTSGDGLDVSANAGSGVSATSTAGGDGVYGFAANPVQYQGGVVGVAASASSTGKSFETITGVWGDTGADSDKIAYLAVGVLGTADNSYAGMFLNDSKNYSTLFVANYGTAGVGTAGTGTPGLFNTFMASGANGTCGISDGSMSCTGPVKSLASTGGSRTVETYAMQSPENWMEDFGSGDLVNGHATVNIDPAFAATVAGDASYHVFITPNGDSKGLYVTSKTANGFEVRESGGGTSSLGFDYRIVAKRAGYEGQRLVDVTETFTRETARAKLVRTENIKPAVQVKRTPSPLEQALKTPHRTIVPPPAPRRIAPQANAAPAHTAAPAPPVVNKQP